MEIPCNVSDKTQDKFIIIVDTICRCCEILILLVAVSHVFNMSGRVDG